MNDYTQHVEEIIEMALEEQKLQVQNLKGFTPKEFEVLKKHEKSYIAKKE